MLTLEKYKFTTQQFMRMQDAFNPEDRVELIDGEIICMSPINPPHANALMRLSDFFYTSLELNQYAISIQNPVELDDKNLPNPDLVIVLRPIDPSTHIKASQVVLLIEVSDTTYRFDKNEKLALYAKAGIIEYWIVNVKKKQIEVFKEPVGETYKKTIIYRQGDMVSVFNAELSVQDVF